ncbi:MAG TPA: hypothetical protein PLM00_06595 [Spirochaetota bacterium]|nr:hypothetical protein [Spirochaetota bacterium]HPN83043.1 hypothetical protein [Spirochaetota bacterium]
MSQAENRTWRIIRVGVLGHLRSLTMLSIRIRTGLEDVPECLSLLEEFSATAGILEEHETLSKEWRRTGLVLPDPVLESLIRRRRKRLLAVHARVSLALEANLGKLPLMVPVITMDDEGRFALRTQS